MTGTLVAKNLSGFLVTEFEPYVKFPVFSDVDYNVTMRTITPQGPSKVFRYPSFNYRTNL